MTVTVSTKFKEMILDASSFASIFNQGRVLIYSGAQPSSADYPVTGTLLGQITLNGQPWVANGSDGGLIWERFGGWMGKPAASMWKLAVDVTGVAGWFRIVGPSTDNGELSYSAPRIDGAIGTAGAFDFFLAETYLTTGQALEVQQFSFTFPPVGG